MKNTKQKRVLSEFLSNRGNLIELIIVAIILGIGIEFISSSLYDKITINHKNLYFFIAGILFCFFSIGYFFSKFFGIKKVNKNIKGFLIIDKENNEIVSIDNYDYARTIERNLKAATSEDKAIKMDWDDSSFRYDATKEKRQKKFRIINELTEYYVLETMSTHLTDFFNQNNIDKGQLVELSRNDIPTILLSNQFLELFSKPMEQRAAFKNEKNIENEDKKPVGKIVASFSNGAIFQHFDFVLPKDSQINKEKDGFIVIKTKRLTLKYKSKFAGAGSVCPIGYQEYYLGIKDHRRYSTYQIDIELEFELKFGALLMRNGWDTYNWVDSLLEKIEKRISKKDYFDRIDWDKAYVIIKSTKERTTVPNIV
jgi:hypothetical protein